MVEDYVWFNNVTLRYYRMSVQKDMLNEIVVTYTWSGRCSKKGGKKHICVSSQEEVKRHITYMLNRRNKRGYTLITPTDIRQNNIQ